MNLYKHQTEALAKINSNDKDIINIICGDGKTLIMKDSCKNYTVSAIFVPTKNLVERFLR